MWTDSTITYTWINSNPSRWKNYVHNRVCYIQETLLQAQWKFIFGYDNPADLATRGLTPMQLSEQSSWWAGPSWLADPSESWPQNSPPVPHKEILEERPAKMLLINIQTAECWNLLLRYSDLNQLLRITAICQRVIKRFRKEPHTSLRNPLTTEELQLTKFFWVKRVQKSAFQQELQFLTSKTLPSSHPLLRLTPFIDSDGILRIGGRLQASLLTEEAKHPIILPKDSAFSTLVIRTRIRERFMAELKPHWHIYDKNSGFLEDVYQLKISF